ncbi:DNA-directed RNA polymerase II subunit rpb1-like isoform X2 [Argiope bruennichi]|uniref:DNA-directed RNA polymerase II subunit rpb1-like isoform X2 n=1 Tax=Argiope bruennichi TaxID=94029 RepID=UPI002494B768|nr:DNA-directed RNA polymerase II subunit rpb1-like isoform X2 [Argiope bruennichi]
MAHYKIPRYQLLLIVSSMVIVSLGAKISEKTQKDFKKSKPSELSAAASVAMKSFKLQSVSPRSSASAASIRYGYPYAIAPTLSPGINARSDDLDKEAIIPQAKSFGSKVAASEESFKKAPKKYKSPFSFGATRRLGFDSDEETSTEKKIFNYRTPKYRNYDELESVYQPRRVDISSPYSSFSYTPKSSRRPPVSPRDPYLSPSHEPSDTFYPSVPKVKSYGSSYSDRDVPSYGVGKYEDPYSDVSGEYGKSSYSGSSSYAPTGGHYGYEEDYTIESNKPITGDIRKRLLDYAGASDLYEGEPDYLQEIARNKHKYGHVANDYYGSGPQGYRSSYRDFPYVESKVSVVKKPRS